MQPHILQTQLRRVLLIRMIWIFAATAIVLFVLRMFPGVDVYVARLFFTEEPCKPAAVTDVCGRFLLLADPTLNAIRDVSLFMPYFMGVLIVLYLLYQLVFERQTTVEDLKKTSLVLWTVLLATIVLINLILKEIWGRPRPFQIDGLGGSDPFVLPGTISEYCASNCSFVSGEASGAAWFFAFLVFLDKRWRWPAGILIGMYLIFFSGLRIAFGRHFLSDVVMSSLFTLCVFVGLQYLFSTATFNSVFEKVVCLSNQYTLDWRKKSK